MRCITGITGITVAMLIACMPAILEAQETFESEISISSVNVRIGVGFPFNDLGMDVNRYQLAPILGLIGVGMDVRLLDFLTFAPFLDISFNDVAYSDRTGLVHPHSFVDLSSLDNTSLLLFYFGLPLVFQFDITDRVRGGIGLSPTLIFRAPLNGPERGRIGNYYIERGRFFYPEVSVHIGYQFQEVELVLLGRVLIPISNLWDNDASSFIHDMAFLLTVQIRFLLPDSEEDSENPIVFANK